MIDAIDTRILTILQQDARAANAEIARSVGLAPSAVHERIRKLERRGVIRGYEVRLNPEELGLDLLAFVFVQVDERQSEQRTGEQIAKLPEVLEVHHLAGEDCYLVKVRCASTQALGVLLRDGFGAFEAVRRTRTTIVLGTILESSRLPLPEVEKEAPHAAVVV
ncbi:MAG: Lrp/AsnC family transcriptional regulator [Thermoanaerobaculia bacterium]